ncbi:pentapeptide repeat-containing protein [Hassallia byssoidea VB512170]|uniref:Pentapeptide repeat-containing protein n=1 Tax=Hassallia byssoidea VB512170 TaxID=1304833 RepID=A0A846H8D6_9CYAN|nr:pentapeptide repeat-containing protein [Hassalia byssoidea]NEU73218.1 pentapeptide repeat-containing protein [Hassalia byssoidea VB512170]
MSANKTDTLLNRLIAISVIFTVSLTLILLAFSHHEKVSTQQKIENRNQTLTTSAIVFLGLAGMINVYYAAKRTEALEKSAIAAQRNIELGIQNTKLNEDRLIAERFMAAIEQLGHDKVETRTGAIYALERVAQDFPKEHWTIMEILSAFVRENAPILVEQRQQTEEDSEPRFGRHIRVTHREHPDDLNWLEESPRIRTDIQVALTVIGRRDSQKDPVNQKIDLRNTHIRRADLRGVYFAGADLSGSDLCGADLRSADLCGADLDKAQLCGSILYEANLQSCSLMGANLSGANLNKVKLCGANLRAANLSGASLRAADLTDANLYKANLQQATLKLANLCGAKLFLANLQQAKFGKANLQNTGLIGANLQQANLNGANLSNANLNAAKLQQTDVLFANLSKASLIEVDLYRANLMGANLQRAILHEANLCEANLMGANLYGANLCDVKLEGAILTGAKNLDPQQIRVALGDRTTRLPDNVEAPMHWRQTV